MTKSAVGQSRLAIILSVFMVLQLLLPFSGVDAATTKEILIPPSNLEFSQQTPSDITLDWNDSTQSATYNVYEVIDNQKKWLKTVNSSQTSLTNLTEGSHIYAVSVLKGTVDSELSPSVTVEIEYPDMQAPTNLSYTIESGSDILLKWEASPHAKSYNVYQIVGGQQKLLGTSTNTALTYKVTKQPEGTHTFAVTAAHNLYGESPRSQSLSVELIYPKMQAPTNLTHTIVRGGDITLNWEQTQYAQSYKVYQIVNNQPTLLKTATTTTTTLSKMPEGSYTLAVSAVNSSYGESPLSQPISFQLEYPDLAPPTNSSYQIKNGYDITLTWTAATYANSYNVYRISQDGTETLFGTSTATSKTFAKMPEGTYKLALTTVSTTFGESALSEPLTIEVAYPDMVTPTNFSYKFVQVKDVALTWTAAPYAQSYNIYKIINGEKTLLTTSTSTSKTLTQLPVGTYVVALSSVHADFGESPLSQTISFEVKNPDVLPPTNITYQIKNGYDIALTWTAATYASKYNMYRIAEDGTKTLLDYSTVTSKTLAKMPEGTYKLAFTTVSTTFGESAMSEPITIDLVHPDMTSPTNLSHKIVQGKDIALTWTASPYAQSYHIYRIINGEKTLLTTSTAVSKTLTKLPEGTYVLVVSSVHADFGESPLTQPITVNLTYPDIDPPANFSYSIARGNDIVLKWDAVPYATEYKIFRLKDSSQELVTTVPGSLSKTLINQPEGTYKFVISTYSTQFGESVLSDPLEVQIVFPNMQAPTNPTTFISNGNDVTIRWTASEYATSYNIYPIVNGQRQQALTAPSISRFISNMPEGTFTYDITSVSDRFGESEQASTVTVTIVHPIMQVPANFKSSITNGNDLTVSWNPALYATSYNLYQVKNGQKVLVGNQVGNSKLFTNALEGTYTYEVTSVSTRFGESPERGILTVQVIHPKMETPVVTVVSGTAIQLSWKAIPYATSYKIYELVDDKPTFVKSTTSLTNTLTVPDGVHEYVVTSVSERFGESPYSSKVRGEVGLAAPVLTATVQNTNVALTWTNVVGSTSYNLYQVQDGQSKLLKNQTATSYQVNGLASGTYEFRVHPVTTLGKEGHRFGSATVQIDLAAPVTTGNFPNGWTNQDVTVQLTATDDVTGVAKTFYSVNGGAEQEGTTVSFSNEGVHNVSFYSVDKKGHTETPHTGSVQIDKTAPVTTAVVEENGAVVLNATDNLSGIATTFYSINGEAFVEGNRVTLTSKGLNQITYYSQDHAGNRENSGQIDVVLDQTAPVTTATAVQDWTNQDVTVTLAATDEGTGVDKTFYSIDEGAEQEGTSFTISQEGIHQVTFYSVDKIGNQEEVQTLEVKIDKTKPTINFNTNETYTYGTVLKLAYTAQDEHSGIATEEITVNGQTYQNGDSLTLTQTGNYKVVITVADRVAWTTTVEKEFFVYAPATIDVTPRVIKGNKGVFTVRVDVANGLSLAHIDPNSVTLNGVKPISGKGTHPEKGQFKFERADFTWPDGEVTLEFRATIKDQVVIGYATVRSMK